MQDHQMSQEEKFKDYTRKSIDTLYDAVGHALQQIEMANRMINVLSRLTNRSAESIVKEVMDETANKEFSEAVAETIKKIEEARKAEAEKTKEAVEQLAIKKQD